MWYFEEGGVVLFGRCGTLKKVFGTLKLWCGTLKTVVWYFEDDGVVL